MVALRYAARANGFVAWATLAIAVAPGCGAATTQPASDAGVVSDGADGAESSVDDAGENCGCGPGPFWVEVEGAPDDPQTQTFGFPGPPVYVLREQWDAAAGGSPEDAGVDRPFRCEQPSHPGLPTPRLVCDPAPVPWAAETTGAISRLELISACAEAGGNGACIALRRGLASGPGHSFYRDRMGRLHVFRIQEIFGDQPPFSTKPKDTVTGSFVGTLLDGRTISGRFRACTLLGCSLA